MQKIYLVFYVIFVLTGIGQSQTLRFDQFTTKNGLLSDEIFNLHQDKDGYLWIFTNYGAMKYNSQEFKPALPNLPVSESFMYCMFENSSGRKWVANSKAKIFEIKNDSAFAIEGIENVSKELVKHVHEIIQLYVDDSLNIYAITKKNCYKFICLYKNTYKAYLLNEGFSNDLRVIERNGALLPTVNSNFRSYYYSDTLHMELEQENKMVRYNIPSKNRGGPKHFISKDSAIYFSFYNRLVKINKAGKLSYIQLNDEILDFKIDQNHHVWIACFNNGLLELNERDSLAHHYLDHTTVNNILIDSQGGLWASTAGSGLYYCTHPNTLHFAEDGAITFIKLIGKRLFFGHANGNVYTIHHDTITCIKEGLKSNPPRDLVKFNTGYMLSQRISNELLDITGSLEARTLNTIKELTGSVNKLAAVNNQQLLYITRNYIGLLENGHLKQTFSADHKLNGFELRKKEMIIGTDNGVYLLTAKALDSLLLKNNRKCPDFTKETAIKLKQPAYLSATLHSDIYNIQTDGNGSLWFSSIGNGLFELTGSNELHHYLAANGLPSDIINDISFTPDRFMLLSTNAGIYLGQIPTAKLEKSQWEKIYNEAVRSALFYENKIYAGTNSGLVILDYKKKAVGTIYFNLAAIFVNSIKVNRGDIKRLRYDQNNIDLDFDLIDFSNDPIAIRYLLTGPIKESGEVRKGRLTFQHLPAGSYILQVSPNMAEGSKIELEFYIEPAIWQTSWFIITSALLLVLLLYFILKRTVINSKQKEIKKLEAERLIAEYKLIALKAQINPHFMSNCLSAIQNLIYKGDIDEAGEYMAKFSVFLRKILNYSDLHYLSLEEEIAIIQLNVELEQLRFKGDFMFNLTISPGISLSETLIPALITQPFIENAIWHGLLPLKGRSPCLNVSIYREGSISYLAIEDNGVGRKNREVLTGNTSKGTQLAMDKIDSINRLLNSPDYNLEIVDLFDENNLPAGTKIIIRLAPNIPDE